MIQIQHVTRIRIHVTRIRIHVTRIRIQHEMRILILHVKRIDLVQGMTTVKEDGGQKWTSFCPNQGCMCAEGGERHTGNKLWRFF